jgi:hypothetical protein
MFEIRHFQTNIYTGMMETSLEPFSVKSEESWSACAITALTRSQLAQNALSPFTLLILMNSDGVKHE